MEIESLDQGIMDKEPINKPVHICFTQMEFERWILIRKRLRAISGRLKIQEFARLSLRAMCERLEELIEKHENKSINKVDEKAD